MPAKLRSLLAIGLVAPILAFAPGCSEEDAAEDDEAGIVEEEGAEEEGLVEDPAAEESE